MLLFILLTAIMLILIIATVFVVSIGGAVGIILFSDVIVCIVIIAWIIKKILKKK